MTQIIGAGRQAPTLGVMQVIDVTSATYTLTEDQQGSLVLFNLATGIDITLPVITADNIGMWFRFQVDTPVSGDTYTITAGAATQLYSGRVIAWDTDTSYGTISYAPDETNDVILTLNATTTGGGVGDDEFLFIAESVTRWRVTGQLFHTSNTATPFS